MSDKTGLLVSADSRFVTSGATVWLDGVDVSSDCIAADDRQGWVLLAGRMKLFAGGSVRICCYELFCGEVVFVGVPPLSIATLLVDVAEHARRDEREAVCERLARAGFTTRIEDDVWERPIWMRPRPAPGRFIQEASGDVFTCEDAG